MRMTDVVSSMDLSIFPEIGLLIFLGVFAVVVLRTLLLSDRREHERAAGLPLERDAAAGATGEAKGA
jgi:hypothetical protein